MDTEHPLTVQNISVLWHAPNQTIPVDTFASYLYQINFNIIFPLLPVSKQVYLLEGFKLNFFMRSVSTSLTYGTNSSNHFLFEVFMQLTYFGE
jgi:hypothetical protein